MQLCCTKWYLRKIGGYFFATYSGTSETPLKSILPTLCFMYQFYGNKLPYSSDSLVTNSCVDCKEPDNYDNKNNNDQQDADNILDVCQRLYEDAGKCESSLSSSIPYPNTYACDFIKTLPKVSTWSISKSAAVPAKALAGVFAVTTVALGALTVFLHKKVAAKGGLAQGLSPTDAELA